MGCITVLVARACAELRGSYSNRNGSHMYHNFGLNCPPYTQQYSSPKLGVVRNWGGLLYSSVPPSPPIPPPPSPSPFSLVVVLVA